MALALTFAWAGVAAAAPYALSDTEVIPFAAKDGVHQFDLLVALPRHYADDEKPHPVIYLLDADYSFAIARNVLRHFNDRHQLEDAIIVGLAYPGADGNLDIYKRTRTRDYTPSHVPKGGYGPEYQKLSGGADSFLNVLQNEVLPFIDKRYVTDPKARMIVGHSYGGLFATYAMLTRPGLFRDYLIVSPSYWYDDKMIFAVAKRTLAHRTALPAHAVYAVGSFENQPQHGRPMVDDVKVMDALLNAAHLKGYESAVRVFTGETHNSIFPAALTRGLRILYGFKGEASPQEP